MLCLDKTINATELPETVVLLSRTVIKIYTESGPMHVVLVEEGKEMWPVGNLYVLLFAP